MTTFPRAATTSSPVPSGRLRLANAAIDSKLRFCSCQSMNAGYETPSNCSDRRASVAKIITSCDGSASGSGRSRIGVDDAEDGAVGADAEREGDDGGGREAGIPPQHADGVDEVLPQRVEERQAAAIAVALRGLRRRRRAASSASRRASSGVMPARTLSSMWSCRWLSSSAAISRSCRAAAEDAGQPKHTARRDLMTPPLRASGSGRGSPSSAPTRALPSRAASVRRA